MRLPLLTGIGFSELLREIIMGNLTNDMTRLRGEIETLRNAQSVWIQNLAAKVSAMRAAFVVAHRAMAKKTKMDLNAYLSGIKKRVSGMRKENRADLAGARFAWNSKSNLHKNNTKRSK